jgi:hypothetical protein
LYRAQKCCFQAFEATIESFALSLDEAKNRVQITQKRLKPWLTFKQIEGSCDRPITHVVTDKDRPESRHWTFLWCCGGVRCQTPAGCGFFEIYLQSMNFSGVALRCLSGRCLDFFKSGRCPFQARSIYLELLIEGSERTVKFIWSGLLFINNHLYSLFYVFIRKVHITMLVSRK